MGGLLKFVVGGAVGTAFGLVIASLTAPKKGSEFQSDVHQRLADTKAAGEEAERQTIASLEHKFRQTVGDHQALRDGAKPAGGIQ